MNKGFEARYVYIFLPIHLRLLTHMSTFAYHHVYTLLPLCVRILTIKLLVASMY